MELKPMEILKEEIESFKKDSTNSNSVNFKKALDQENNVAVICRIQASLTIYG